MLPPGQMQKINDDYVRALIAGNRSEASGLLSQARRSGVGTREIYLSLLTPALVTVGRQYHAQKIGITEEHVATQIVLDHASVLREQHQVRNNLGVSVFCCTSPSESHGIACRMMADLFWFDGWEVLAPGVGIPHEDLVNQIGKTSFNFIALSIPLDIHTGEAKRLIKDFIACGYGNRILVGGETKKLSRVREVHILSGNVDSAITHAYSLIGTKADQLFLDRYLSELGQRISKRRKDSSLSQAEVAARAGIDRGYLSALENGKENCSIGVISRVSASLGVSLESLLTGGS